MISEKADLVEEYARWMSHLESLDLLDVDKLVPLVKGDQLSKALGGIKKGPWLKQALDIAMEWQLRNPLETDPSGGVEEVRLLYPNDSLRTLITFGGFSSRLGRHRDIHSF